jgi:F0F1-type ATP synthase assembly protein I
LDLAKWSQLSMGGGNSVADGFSKAVEFVVTPLVCGVIGHFLDAWLGTGPILTVVLGAWALAVTVGMAVRRYGEQMRVEEEKLLGPRPGRSA